jgi:hypothetical protein
VAHTVFDAPKAPVVAPLAPAAARTGGPAAWTFAKRLATRAGTAWFSLESTLRTGFEAGFRARLEAAALAARLKAKFLSAAGFPVLAKAALAARPEGLPAASAEAALFKIPAPPVTIIGTAPIPALKTLPVRLPIGLPIWAARRIPAIFKTALEAIRPSFPPAPKAFAWRFAFLTAPFTIRPWRKARRTPKTRLSTRLTAEFSARFPAKFTSRLAATLFPNLKPRLAPKGTLPLRPAAPAAKLPVTKFTAPRTLLTL